MRTRRPPTHPHVPRARGGLTLFEIVLALTIFTLAMAAMSQLITVGTRAKNTAQFQTEAALRAENKMAEVVAGHRPLSAVTGEADPENDRWLWSLNVDDAANASGLKELTVTVTHLSQTGQVDTAYAIKRLLRDPQLYIDAAAEEEQKAADAAAKQGSSGSGSSGGTKTGSGSGTGTKTGSGTTAPSAGSSAGSQAGSGSSSAGSKASSGTTSSKAKPR